MSRVMITGAAGFIGSQLAHMLWKHGEELILVDDYSYGSTDNLSFEDRNFENDILDVDITDACALESVFIEHQPEYVYHIAGIAPLPDCQSNPYRACCVNIGGTINVLECSRKYGIKNVVFASTSAIYENDIEFPSKEGSVVAPSLIYPSTKYCAEQFCKSYHDTYGLNVVAMRFANVYGPHIDCLRKQPPFVAYVIRELYYNRSPVLHSNGKQTRDYVYVEDLLNLAYQLKDQVGFDIVNVSSNTSYSVNEMYDIIANLMGVDIKATFTESSNYWNKYPRLYEGVLPIKESILDSEVNKHTLCDNAHARDRYGWIPKTALEEGLKNTIEYTVRLLRNKE